MNKKLVIYILGSVLLVTVIGVYLVLGSLDQPAKDIETVESSGSGGNAANSSAAPETDSSLKANTPNPFEEGVKTPLKETLMQQYIHAMSHQKVEAEEKWSFFKITDDRIGFLLNQLEVNKYKNEDLYRSILLKWKEGDFSDAASHHNAVWRLQQGTIGKATGNLSAKEEEVFLQKQTKESR
ncbi:hypothetical protein A6P54_12450 [Bacillus sp. MKU004]|nr:hypothetical protein A6P54_12450 [Bacillus sp. MKU004]